MHRQTLIRCGSLLLASAIFFAAVRESAAQSQSLFSNRNQNSQQSGDTRGGNSGQSGNSTSLFNPTQMGLNLRGQSGQGQQGQQGMSGTGLGNVFGNGFVGRRDDTNDFIGRRTNTTTGGRNAQGGQNRNRRRGAGSNTGRRRFANNQNQTQNDVNNPNSARINGQQQVRQMPRRISTRHRIDFPSPVVAGSAIESTVASRFKGVIAKRIDAKRLEFEVEEGGVLVMRGEVATPQDKDLAELIAAMEPGVRGVRNELEVAVGDGPELSKQSGATN